MVSGTYNIERNGVCVLLFSGVCVETGKSKVSSFIFIKKNLTTSSSSSSEHIWSFCQKKRKKNVQTSFFLSFILYVCIKLRTVAFRKK